MTQNPRASGDQWLRTAALSLVTVITLLGMSPLGISLLPVPVRIVCYLLAPILVIASVMRLLRVITASGTVAQRGARASSIIALAFLLGYVDLSIETMFIAPSSVCQSGATGACTVALASLAFVLKLMLLVTCGAVSIAGVADGLASAANARRWSWFAAIIAYLVASIAMVAVRATSLSPSFGEFGWYGLLVSALYPDAPAALFPLFPYLTPVLTLMYSLTDQAKSVRT